MPGHMTSLDRPRRFICWGETEPGPHVFGEFSGLGFGEAFLYLDEAVFHELNFLSLRERVVGINRHLLLRFGFEEVRLDRSPGKEGKGTGRLYPAFRLYRHGRII
jgi:hypothetical protein